MNTLTPAVGFNLTNHTQVNNNGNGNVHLAWGCVVLAGKQNDIQAEATDESYKIHRNLKDEVISVAVSKKRRCEGKRLTVRGNPTL